QPIRIALPRGDLRTPLAERLDAVGLHVPGYGEGSRTYRFEVDEHPAIQARVFSDHDIPIQVALGQYDLGIASRTWIDELLVRYRHDSIVPLRCLDVGGPSLVVAGEPGRGIADLAASGVVRVATEYPNLAGHYMTRLRVPDYRVFEVWAQAEAWPPEDAELAICSADAAIADGLEILGEVHHGGVWLIANERALQRRDLSEALTMLLSLPRNDDEAGLVEPHPLAGIRRAVGRPRTERQTFR